MSLEEGCRMAVETCMGINENDRVVIVSDDDSNEIGMGLRKIALEKTSNVRYYNLNLYRPLKKFPKEIKDAAMNATATFWTAKVVEGELEIIRMPFIKMGITGGRHAHMVGITNEIMETSMASDFKEIDRFSQKLMNKIDGTNSVKVTNYQGTNFTARFGGGKWAPATVINHKIGHHVNLPSSETFTCPSEMEGKIIVDGVLGGYLGNKYLHKDLQEEPLTIFVENKKHPTAVRWESDNKKLIEDLDDFFSRQECSSWVGQIGFGTNIFLKDLIDNVIQDEGYPGAHVAFGDPFTSETYAGWSCPEQLSTILTECDIWLDDEKIMEEGEYLIDY